MTEKPQIKKAYKCYGKEDGAYEIHYAEIFYAENRTKVKFQYQRHNYEDWINIIAIRVPEQDLYLFEDKWLSKQDIDSKIAERTRKAKINALPDDTLYMVQDRRSYVGNSVLWHAKGGNGYTTNFDNADLLTADEIKKQYWRETDIIWSIEDVNKGVMRHVDMQYLDRKRSI